MQAYMHDMQCTSSIALVLLHTCWKVRHAKYGTIATVKPCCCCSLLHQTALNFSYIQHLLYIMPSHAYMRTARPPNPFLTPQIAMVIAPHMLDVIPLNASYCLYINCTTNFQRQSAICQATPVHQADSKQDNTAKISMSAVSVQG